MKCTIKNATTIQLIDFASHLKGCYAEYQFSKQISDELKAKSTGYQFDKTTKEHEYWKDIDKNLVDWRIKLK
jgi:hypothetical protein